MAYYVSSGQISSGIILNSNTMYVSSGGTAVSTTVNSIGQMYVSSGGTAISTTVNSRGNLYVYSGGTVMDLAVSGYVLSCTVSSGGVLSSATVGSRSFLSLSPDASASDLTIESGGRAYASGAELSGSIKVSRGGILFAVGSSRSTTLADDLTLAGELRTDDKSKIGYLNASGHTIKLDLTGRQTEELAFIDDLARLSDFVLSVSVSDTQKSGLYNLAGDAAGFSGTITICNTAGSCVSLATGGSASLGTQSYQLNVTGSVLTLTVTNTGTEKAADIKEYTPGTWSTDWIQASTYAKAHNLPIFAYFGDPTWCGYCKDMNTELFESTDFQEFARENLVLLYATPVPGKSYSGAPAAYLLNPDGTAITSKAGFPKDGHDTWMGWLRSQFELDTAGVFVYSGGELLSVYKGPVSGLSLIGASYFCHVSSAVLTDTQIQNYGTLYIQSGGTASKIDIESRGYLYLSNGAVVNSVTLNSGFMYVSSGCTASEVTVNFAGYLWAGGTVLNVRENGGCVDGAVQIVPHSFSGLELPCWKSATIHSGTTVNSVNVLSGGSLEILSGGSATNVCASSQGGLSIEVAPGTYVQGLNAGSEFEIKDAKASAFTVLESGALYIQSGGMAIETTVNSRGFLFVKKGGIVSSSVIDSGGHLGVSRGGTAHEAFIHSGGSLKIWSGAAVRGITLQSGGTMFIYSGGTAGSLQIESGAVISASAGAAINFDLSDRSVTDVPLVNNLSLIQGDLNYSINVSADQAEGTYLLAEGAAGFNKTFTICNTQGVCGTIAVGNTVQLAGQDYALNLADSLLTLTVGGSSEPPVSGDAVKTYSGSILVSSANVMTGKTLVSGGAENIMRISSGGVANDTVVNTGGGIYVSGGVANFTTLNSRGYMYVSSGGTVNSVTAYPGGFAYVYSGGSANNATISGGYLRVSSGGMANSTTIDANGEITVCSGGVANEITVSSDGRLTVSGGTATGVMRFAEGALVYADEGGVINFDVSEITADAEVRINNLSLVQGVPIYTITVAADQAQGTYKLADGAAGFDKTVTICTTAGVCDSLTVGNTVELAGQSYTLNLTDALLTLTADGVTPPTPAGSLPGDLNGDDRADIVMTITQAGHGAEGATGAWLIQPDQTAAWGDLSQRNAGWEIFGTGITAAGKSTNDVYVKSTDNVIGAWVTDDTGHVAGWETIDEFSADTQIVGLGDFNGNGQADLLLRNTNGAVGCFFTGGAKTGWNYFQSLGDEWKLSAVGDLNGDGRDDIVLKHDAGFAGSWLTQADGTMAWADLDTLPNGFNIVGAGDFNGDGTDDVLLQNGTYFGAWLVNNGNAAGWMGLGDLGNVTVEQIADFNGDGKDDLRIRTMAGDLGTQLVMGEDNLSWKYYGSVGREWSTSLAALA